MPTLKAYSCKIEGYDDTGIYYAATASFHLTAGPSQTSALFRIAEMAVLE